MKKTGIIFAVLFAACAFASCVKDDGGSFKWREEWGRAGADTTDVPTDTSGVPGIKGKPRYVWVDAAANFR